MFGKQRRSKTKRCSALLLCSVPLGVLLYAVLHTDHHTLLCTESTLAFSNFPITAAGWFIQLIGIIKFC